MLLKSKSKVMRDSHPGLPLDPDAARPGAYKWPPHVTPSLQMAVFVGGSLGTLARYELILRLPAGDYVWPWATLFVNLLGAFLLGLLLEALFRIGNDKKLARLVRLGVGTGFMGAFTTYGALAVETNLLLAHNHLAVTITYALGSVIGGIVASALGILAATTWHKNSRGAQ